MWWHYAPSNNPKIAVAVVFTNLQATVSHSITRDSINLYNQNTPWIRKAYALVAPIAKLIDSYSKFT